MESRRRLVPSPRAACKRTACATRDERLPRGTTRPLRAAGIRPRRAEGPRRAAALAVVRSLALERSILLPLHRAAGAELSGAEPPLVLAFGEVPDEYRAGVSGCALFDQTDRGLVAVSGPDARVFLHRLLANDVRGLEPPQGNANLLLSSKGKVRFQLDLSIEPERVLLGTPPGRAAALRAALDVFLFTEKVELAELTESCAPLALCGPEAPAVCARVLGGEPPREDHASRTLELGGTPVRVTALPVAGAPGLRLDPGPERAAALWSALVAAGALPAGRIAWDSLRVELGEAEPGIDVDENVYPQEARLERAFSLNKGCYVGQEVVAKIDTYQGLNKRLLALRVSHDDPVPRGTRLVAEERELGLVTSWAYSFALDCGLVLAYVKRRHQDVGTRFHLAGAPGEAEIVELPVQGPRGPATGTSVSRPSLEGPGPAAGGPAASRRTRDASEASMSRRSARSARRVIGRAGSPRGRLHWRPASEAARAQRARRCESGRAHVSRSMSHDHRVGVNAR